MLPFILPCGKNRETVSEKGQNNDKEGWQEHTERESRLSETAS